MKRTKRRNKLFVVVSLILVFLMMLCLGGCNEDNGPSIVRTSSAVKDARDKDDSSKTTGSAICIIEELNMLEETITVYNTVTDTTLRYNYNLTTRFLDKYGAESSSLNFTPGTAVTLGEKTKSNVLSSVKMSDKVWTQTDVKNYMIDSANNKIKIGKTEYMFTDKICVYAGSEPVNIGTIGTEDTLKITGINESIISIAVTTGHGFIQFVNTTGFDGTMVQIGDKIFTKVTSEMLTEVPEGEYDITVASNGFGGTVHKAVKQNEITVVDLEDFVKDGRKECEMSFVVSVPGTAIYIDGNQVNANDVLKVPYGVHRVIITASGYNNWDKTLYVNSPKAVIAVELSSETSKTNDNSSNNSSSSNSSSKNKNSSDSKSNDNTENKSDSNKAELDYLSTISNTITNLMGSIN